MNDEPASTDRPSEELRPRGSPHDADLAAVHECFAALLEGDAARARAFGPGIRRAAEQLVAEHAQLEAQSLPEPRSEQARRASTVAPGTQVGAYRVESLLGRGAIGEVHAALETATGRRVALKILPVEASRAADARVDREIRALAALEHPGIARLYSSGLSMVEGAPRRHIAMELVRGARTLAEWRASDRPDRATRLRTIAAIADAVSYAHGRGVIHCDLKPGNVLVDADGRPVVIDFGISRLVEREADPRATVSLLGARVAGTLAYIAPESLEPGAAADVRADIHALGAMLYELLAERPFRALDGLALPQRLARIAVDAPPVPSHADRSLKGDLDRIVARATALDPAARYASASQFADDLRAHLEGRAVQPELQGARERLVRALRRHRGAVALGSFVALLLVATTVVSLRFAREARHDARLANLAAAARALDASDLLLLEQHVDALDGALDGVLSEGDESIERALLDRALEMQGSPVVYGDLYGFELLADGSGAIANGHLERETATSAAGHGGRVELYRRQGAADDGLEGPFTSRLDRRPDGRLERRWKQPAGESLLAGIAASADGLTVLDYDDDGALRAWNALDGSARGALPPVEFMRAGLAIAVRGDGLVADGRDVVMLRRIDDLAREVGRVDPAVGPIRALAFSPANPRHLAVAGRHGAALVELEELRVAQRFETPAAMQAAIAWSADGSRVHIAGWDRTLRAYRTDASAPLWTARGHRDIIWSIARLDDETLATTGADGSLRLWRAGDGAPIATVPASRDVLWKVLHDALRAELVLVARGRTSVLGLARLRAWAGIGPRDWRSAIAANGAIAEPRDDGTVWFRDSGDATARVLQPEGAGHAERVALSRDASLLFALRSDGTLSLVDTARGDVRWSTRTLAAEDLHESNGIPNLAVDAAGRLALVASRAQQCVALSLETGEERWRAAFGAGCVAVAASSDGRRVFACDRVGILASIDARDGRVLRTVRRQRTRIAALATADDDTRLLVACTDGSLRIVDAESLEEILFLAIAPVALRAVWVAPDGIHTVDDHGVERVR